VDHSNCGTKSASLHRSFHPSDLDVVFWDEKEKTLLIVNDQVSNGRLISQRLYDEKWFTLKEYQSKHNQNIVIKVCNW